MSQVLDTALKNGVCKVKLSATGEVRINVHGGNPPSLVIEHGKVYNLLEYYTVSQIKKSNLGSFVMSKRVSILPS